MVARRTDDTANLRRGSGEGQQITHSLEDSDSAAARYAHSWVVPSLTSLNSPVSTSYFNPTIWVLSLIHGEALSNAISSLTLSSTPFGIPPNFAAFMLSSSDGAICRSAFLMSESWKCVIPQSADVSHLARYFPPHKNADRYDALRRLCLGCRWSAGQKVFGSHRMPGHLRYGPLLLLGLISTSQAHRRLEKRTQCLVNTQNLIRVQARIGTG